MKTLDFIKLDAQKVQSIVTELQQLLADYQIFYANLRGFHWNIKGKDFFVLHSKFEELYNNVAAKVDELAERILMLNGVPAHHYSEYLKVAKVKESGYVTSGDAGLAHVLDTYSYFIESEKKLIRLAEEAGDETTIAMLTDYISEQEKMIWMLVAYSSK